MPWFLVLLWMGSVMVFVACASTGAHGNHAVLSQTALPWPRDDWPRLSSLDIVAGELVPPFRGELLPHPLPLNSGKMVSSLTTGIHPDDPDLRV